mmetsp:Transcript_78733/g.172598  ORF Transcript_78733/g.172598 Transcript_78733/m.172598 type:complete len:223 (-) Transcript_78733:13-681(-)
MALCCLMNSPQSGSNCFPKLMADFWTKCSEIAVFDSPRHRTSAFSTPEDTMALERTLRISVFLAAIKSFAISAIGPSSPLIEASIISASAPKEAATVSPMASPTFSRPLVIMPMIPPPPLLLALSPSPGLPLVASSCNFRSFSRTSFIFSKSGGSFTMILSARLAAGSRQRVAISLAASLQISCRCSSDASLVTMHPIGTEESKYSQSLDSLVGVGHTTGKL